MLAQAQGSHLPASGAATELLVPCGGRRPLQANWSSYTQTAVWHRQEFGIGLGPAPLMCAVVAAPDDQYAASSQAHESRNRRGVPERLGPPPPQMRAGARRVRTITGGSLR